MNKLLWGKCLISCVQIIQIILYLYDTSSAEIVDVQTKLVLLKQTTS